MHPPVGVGLKFVDLLLDGGYIWPKLVSKAVGAKYFENEQ
jgi:hypothetical protein